MLFVKLKNFPSISCLLGIFLMKIYWTWLTFSTSLEMIICGIFCSMQLLLWSITVIKLNEAYIPGVNSTCSCYSIHSSWIQFANILLRIFASVLGFPSGSVGKNLTANAGDLGSIPGLGRSLGEGNGNPLQYSCLENPMNRGAWQARVHGVIRVKHNLATKPAPPRYLWSSGKLSP